MPSLPPEVKQRRHTAFNEEDAAPPEPACAPTAYQIGGDHYTSLVIQPALFIESNHLPFLEGCVIKRMCRHGNKAEVEDLRKAIHEIKLIAQFRYGVTL